MMHIHSMKEDTKQKRIIYLGAPPVLYLPLLENYGHAPKPIVKVGDKVKKYQVVGKTSEGFSAKIHSPVSGIVKEIKSHLQVGGKEAETIIIENDFLEETVEAEWTKKEYYDSAELVKIIEDAGIVGEGGAQFPTAVKYNIGNAKIHTFIANGVECEPYLTADYSIMIEKTYELLEGILIINQILNAENLVIGIEKQHEDLLETFKPFLQKERYKNIRIVVVPNEYPQGGQLQLSKFIAGIEMPRSARSSDWGIVMNNIGTIYAVYEAVVNQKPLVERIITVSGELSKNYGNYQVKIGTSVEYILKKTGFNEAEAVILAGGPMMGKYVYNSETPINKGSGGILLLKKHNIARLHCISCGYCVDVCPMFLMPFKYEELFRKRKYQKLKKYNIDDCIECAACEYICPCKVPLIESIQKGKAKLKELKDEKN